jgi:hypothetical protein
LFNSLLAINQFGQVGPGIGNRESCHVKDSSVNGVPPATGFVLCPPRSTRVRDLHGRTGDRNGARTVSSSPGGVTVQRSDADDVDEIAESGEVVGIPGVEREAVGVGGGCDEQVGDTPSM